MSCMPPFFVLTSFFVLVLCCRCAHGQGPNIVTQCQRVSTSASSEASAAAICGVDAYHGACMQGTVMLDDGSGAAEDTPTSALLISTGTPACYAATNPNVCNVTGNQYSCQVHSCTLSLWSSWSVCNSCSQGSSSRRRMVLVQAFQSQAPRFDIDPATSDVINIATWCMADRQSITCQKSCDIAESGRRGGVRVGAGVLVLGLVFSAVFALPLLVVVVRRRGLCVRACALRQRPYVSATVHGEEMQIRELGSVERERVHVPVATVVTLPHYDLTRVVQGVAVPEGVTFRMMARGSAGAGAAAVVRVHLHHQHPGIV